MLCKCFFAGKFSEYCSWNFDTVFTTFFFKFETALGNSPKIFQRKKYIKNILMKTLNQHYSNVYIFASSYFKSCVKSNIRKSAD